MWMSDQSEKEKMLAGELYLALDPELANERKHCRTKIHGYNNTLPEQFAERAAILRELLGAVHKSAYIEPPFRCDYGYNIHVGKGFYANFDCVLLDVNPITIGDRVLLGPGVHIYTATHPVDPETRRSFKELGRPITIEDDVWIGGRAILCPGVTIGEGAVIGAGSVVTKDVPPRTLAAGNPCRKIRAI
jgi:maltose O-acetyltransferase